MHFEQQLLKRLRTSRKAALSGQGTLTGQACFKIWNVHFGTTTEQAAEAAR